VILAGQNGKAAPLSIFLQQIPHELAWYLTRASAVMSCTYRVVKQFRIKIFDCEDFKVLEVT